MADYSQDELSAYIASGEPMDKAGAYAIQGRGGDLVESIEGCYYNVVGFPLCEVSRLMASAGVELSSSSPVCRLPSGAACPRLGALST